MGESSGKQDGDTRGGDLDGVLLQIVISFITLSSYYMVHLIDITSRHFAVAFKIPINNISIYFDKLFSIRCLLNVVGTLIEYIIYQSAGGDRNDNGIKVRRYVSAASLIFMFIVRSFYFLILFFSSQLSYHVYLFLSFEALIHGLYDDTLSSLASGHMPLMSLFFNLCRLFILSVQFVLDRLLYNHPLVMIKTQAFVCATFTAISSGLWIYLNFYYPSFNLKKEDEIEKTSENATDGLDCAISPFIMISGATLIKDFLCPGTLPYTLLERDKCHLINMCIPILYLVATATYFTIVQLGGFKRWTVYFNGFLILIIPMAIIFVYCFLAIHTQIPSARAIINSRPRVMAMTLVLVLSAGYLESLNYIAIAKYAYNGNPNGYTIQGINKAYHMLSGCFSTRVSVAYGETRLSLGYHLPKFRPNHNMSKSNLAHYIIRQTFKRSWQGMKKELKMDIKDYL